MDSSWIFEAVGYTASLLIAISLMMRSVLRLRIINLFGSSFFVVYGLLIQAYPVTVMNCVIVIINIYYLRELTRTHTSFSVLESRSDSEYLELFINHYAEELARIFPAFEHRQHDGHIVWFILHGLMPVGLFIAEIEKNHDLLVHVDYVIPGYRDLRPGKYLYTKQKDRFSKLGVTRLRSEPKNSEQRKYLTKMGFVAALEDDTTLCRPVA